MRITFFGTATDTLELLLTLEDKTPLNYVLQAASPSPSSPVYSSAREIPNLGAATVARTGGADHYWLVPPQTEVVREAVPQTTGGTLYFVRLHGNPWWLTFAPGGLFKEECFISSYFETDSLKNQGGVNLYRTVVRVMKKTFVKLKDWYVGPEAMVLLKKGELRFTNYKVGPPDLHDLTYDRNEITE